MIAVENFPCRCHIDAVLRLLAERIIKTNIKIIAQHAALRAAEGHFGKATQLFLQLCGDLFGGKGRNGFDAGLIFSDIVGIFVKFPVLFLLRRAAAPEFVLNDAQLLAQEKFLLAALHLLFHALVNVFLQL